MTQRNLIFAASLIVLLAIGVNSYLGLHNAKQIGSRITRSAERQAVALIHRTELRACHRLNIMRATENRSHHQDYRTGLTQYGFDQLFASLVVAGLKQQTSSTPRTPEQEAQTRLFVGKLRATAKSLLETANTKEWVALTNCRAAGFSPHFVAPTPHTFASRTPPNSVYRVGLGE